MTVDKALETYLKNHATLKQIHKGQVWAGQVAPEGTKGAYITIWPISDPPDMKRLQIPSPRYQIDCYAPDYSQARQMSDLIYQILDGFSGDMNGLMVEMGIYDDMNYNYENDTKLHHISIDVVFTYYA